METAVAAALLPLMFCATTEQMYLAPPVRPLTKMGELVPFAVPVDAPAVWLVQLATYPVMGDPPVFVGGVKARLTWR